MDGRIHLFWHNNNFIMERYQRVFHKATYLWGMENEEGESGILKRRFVNSWFFLYLVPSQKEAIITGQSNSAGYESNLSGKLSATPVWYRNFYRQPCAFNHLGGRDEW
ncbi:MAG: hypothetical protein CVU06_12310 [Bacteroidetes bacterium HGW-Bacteroidetes-22]|nr:MAG: hypothetical protein CVU06_12310 [Bacteroidetes bacterium HGW-Bacteroidetes-22]